MDNLDRMRQEAHEERRDDGKRFAALHVTTILATLAVIVAVFVVIWMVWLA